MPSLPLHLLSKAQLRSALLARRLSQEPSNLQDKSSQICHYLQQSLAFQTAQVILTACCFKQEPNLLPLVQHFPDKIWGLPRCVDQSLVWHRWQWGEPLIPGAYGIFEPAATAQILEPPEIDLIWVPAVACDRNFYRLGYGGGYFDRLFSQPSWANIFRVGVVYEQDFCRQLPRDPWDIPLNAVCTETGYTVNPSLTMAGSCIGEIHDPISQRAHHNSSGEFNNPKAPDVGKHL